MAPALARRTPQVNLNEGRPKRQAALNRKETPGAPKKKNEKAEPKPKVTAVKTVKKPGKQPAKRTSPRKTAAKTSAATSTSKKSAKATNDKNKASDNTVEKEEEVEEENPNEVPLNDDEKNENTTEDSQEEVEEEEDDDNGNESEEESELDDGELEDDDDEDFDPDDDPEKLWCFCKKPHGNRFMICCDTCEEWFHGDCVGISMAKGREMEKTGEEWCCDSCKEMQNSKSVDDALPSKSPLNSPLKKFELKEGHAVTKARSLSLDDMKCNLAKLKDRKLSLAEKKQKIKSESDIKIEGTEEDPRKSDRRDSLDSDKGKTEKPKVEKIVPAIPGFTFDQVPIKKEEKLTRKRSLDLQEDSEELKRKKKEILTAKPKIRTTPTPKNIEPIKSCLREDCNRPVMKGAIYCSRECIYKYTTEAIKVIEDEKRKKSLIASPDSKVVSHGSTIISPATSSTDRVTETTQERIAVFEKSSGKIVAGVMAPTKKYLFAWLEEHPTYEVLKLGKQTAELKNPKKDQNEIVRNIVRKALRDILVSRCKESEMAISPEAVMKISKKIENELLKMYGETSQKYKTKYRSLIFNLKDQQNKILYRRVVSGEISPSKLVHMSPEQLATPELARWREQESKHHIEMVKKRELEAAELSKQTSLKKTHKGEVEINNDNVAMTTLEIRAEPAIERQRSASTSSSSEVMNLLKDTTEEHSRHLFDSNCGICTGKVTPPGESQSTGVSTAVVQAVPESSVPSPEDDNLVMSSPPSPDTSDVSLPSPTTITALPPSARKQPSVWRGFIMMQKVSKFVCTAYAVSGTCENLMETLPDTIQICGRIPPNQVWEYLSQMKEGRKNQNKFIDVIRFEMSSDEEKAGYIKLYTYFYTRQRIGVVGNCYSGVKDMYILPLSSHDPIPAELKPLPGLPKPRPHMLLGIIIRVKSFKKKVSDYSQPDSSPDLTFPKKKKKKKEKKLKEIEKERVEVEAQKKLLDIIFKSRGETSTGSLSHKTLLKSMVDKKNESGDDGDEVGSEKDSDARLEEEQIKKLKEQEEEITRLKQEIESSNQEEGESEMVVFPDPDNVIKNIKESLSESPVKQPPSRCDSEDIFSTSTNDSITTTQTESIPFMSDSPSMVSTELSEAIPFMSASSTVSFDKNLTVSTSEQRDFHPADDDEVMNLIEDIKIPTAVPKFPLDIQKNRKENKMPQLPAISLPLTSDFKLPPPGTIPKVPLPPNIKLPPGVPFPPLPPKPIAPEILQIPTSSHGIPDTPQSPPDSMKGFEQLQEQPGRLEQPIERRIVDPRRPYDFQERPRQLNNPIAERSSSSTGYFGQSVETSSRPPSERDEQRHAMYPQESNYFPAHQTDDRRQTDDRFANRNYAYRDEQQLPHSRASRNYDQPNIRPPSTHMDDAPRMLSWRNKDTRYSDNPSDSDRQQLARPELLHHSYGPGPVRPQMGNPEFREDQFHPRLNPSRDSYDGRNQPGQFDRGPPFNSDRIPFDNERPVLHNEGPPFGNVRPSFRGERPPFHNERPPFSNERPPFNNERPPFNNGRPHFNNGRPPHNMAGGPRFQQPNPRFNTPRQSGFEPRFDDGPPRFQTDQPRFTNPNQRFPRHPSPNVNRDSRPFVHGQFPGPSLGNVERAENWRSREPFDNHYGRGRFDDGVNMHEQRFNQRGRRKPGFVGNRFRDQSDNNRFRERRDERRERKDFGKNDRRKGHKNPPELSAGKDQDESIPSGKDKFGRDISCREGYKGSSQANVQPSSDTKKTDLEDGEVQENTKT